MKVTVRIFASAREAAGWEQRQIELPDDATAAVARAALRKLVPTAAAALDSAALAVNQKYARDEQRLENGDELAILPPVSGG